MKTKQTTTRAFTKIATARQAGVSSLQIVVALAVGALLLSSGAGAFKYIEQQKANNDMAELADIKAGAVDWASKHNTSFNGLNLDIACRQQIFAQKSCTGTGAATAAANLWGGSYAIAATNVSGGTNNGLRLTSPLVPDAVCMKQISYMWNDFALISVGTTGVKTTVTQAIDDAAINSACSGGSNSVIWTIKA